MTILADSQIIGLCQTDTPLISPFSSKQVKVDDNGKKVISWGLSSFGYDIRSGYKYKLFSNVNSAIVDPKNIDSKCFIDVEVKDGEFIIVPPNSFMLTHSLENVCLPRDVTGLVTNKSTYARTGLCCKITVLEAGWSGFITLEYSNTSSLPMKFYPGEGCAQILWFRGGIPCETSYADRDGKYMNQPCEVVLPKV